MNKFLLLILSATFCIPNCFAQLTAHDGKTYKTEIIGTQEWTTENLDASTFSNGDPISEAKTTEEWEQAMQEKKPAWCHNPTEAGITYGKLYNLFALNDMRGLVPQGWHLPKITEWQELISYLGGEFEAGKKMKATTDWSETGKGTNESGFNALPGGSRNHRGEFFEPGSLAEWWSATAYKDVEAPSGVAAYPCYVASNEPDDIYDGSPGGTQTYPALNAGCGLSVRFVKDK